MKKMVWVFHFSNLWQQNNKLWFVLLSQNPPRVLRHANLVSSLPQMNKNLPPCTLHPPDYYLSNKKRSRRSSVSWRTPLF